LRRAEINLEILYQTATRAGAVLWYALKTGSATASCVSGVKKEMMSAKKQVQQDLVVATKQNDELVRSVLRLLLSEINLKEIELGKKEEGLSEEEIQQVVLREMKKRVEAVEQYTRGGREELAARERDEAEVLKKYAPEQIGDEELISIIDDTIKKVGASNISDIGKVMRGVMAAVGSRADGSRVSAMVRERLSR